MLLMDADQAGALAVAEGIRETLAARPVMIRGEPHAMTVSIGVAQLRDGDFDGTLQQADKALYRAKAEGRNRSAAGRGKSSPTSAWPRVRRPAESAMLAGRHRSAASA